MKNLANHIAGEISVCFGNDPMARTKKFTSLSINIDGVKFISDGEEFAFSSSEANEVRIKLYTINKEKEGDGE